MGPRKKDWAEVFPWIVGAIESVVDVPLSMTPPTLTAWKPRSRPSRKPAHPELLLRRAGADGENSVAGEKYGAKVIALTMASEGIPVSADDRVNIAVEKLIPRMMEIDFPMSDLIIDPLVLTCSGCQQYCPHLIETVRTLQYAWEPTPLISVGLSNVSNAVPNENRPLINACTSRC